MSSKLRKFIFAEDFMKVRDFLCDTYTVRKSNFNWTIERWNYARFFVLNIHKVKPSDWDNRVGIWEDDNSNIIGVVHSEDGGDAFFELGSEYDRNLLNEMMDFAEENLSVIKDTKKSLSLWISTEKPELEEIALERGYTKPNWTADTNYLNIETQDFSYKMPDGFKIQSMEFSNELEKRSQCFSRAFNSPSDKITTVEIYKRLQEAPDYNPEFDIYALSSEGDICAFCLIWFDEKNKYAVLEPVGTDPDFRRKGLAKACIYEAIKRVKKLGAQRIFVGSDQKFYQDIGFNNPDKAYILEKSVEV